MKLAAVILVVFLGALGFPSSAAPRQMVVLVSEGLSPQVLQLGKEYLRTADEDPNGTTAFHRLAEAGKSSPPVAFTDLKGLLATASKNGYRTGLVTSGSTLSEAALLYGVDANPEAVLKSNFNVLAGGGRAAYSAPQLQAFKASGNTYFKNESELDGEFKGKTLLLQADSDLSFSIDVVPQVEASFGRLVVIALDQLSADNSPFILIVHETLIKKAIDTKDSPALFEQFGDDHGILLDCLMRRQDHPGLAIISILSGGSTPHFTTADGQEIARSYEALSKMGCSYAGTNHLLEGAGPDDLKEFTDPTEGIYRTWKPTPEVKATLLDGTLKPEAAVRAFYEPLLRLAFDGPVQKPEAVVLGMDAPEGVGPALGKILSTRPE